MHPFGAIVKIVLVGTGLNCEGEPQPSVTMLDLVGLNPLSHSRATVPPPLNPGFGYSALASGARDINFGTSAAYCKGQGLPGDFYTTTAPSSLARCSLVLLFASSRRCLPHGYLSYRAHCFLLPRALLTIRSPSSKPSFCRTRPRIEGRLGSLSSVQAS
jgi:hypothetical protein